ncbi:MAG: tetratricopeptide repeat protein [candidate division Zixibacteria bacterium]|nr:tetratricopeptide repeat protein [candidate division Zixibacteria bacterium]
MTQRIPLLFLEGKGNDGTLVHKTKVQVGMGTTPSKLSWKLWRTTTHNYAAPVLIFIASFALRLAYLFELYSKSPFSGYFYLDAFRYNSWAQSIAFGVQHAIEPTFRAPLYPLFLAAIFKIFGHDLFIARLVQMLLGAWICVMIYFIASRLFNKRVGIISALMVAFYGPLIYWSGEILIVTLIVFLDLVMLLILLKAFDKPRKLLWLLAGAVLGLSSIARPSVLVFTPWVIILILLMNRFRETGARAKLRLVYALCFLAGALVVISPVTISNYDKAKDFVLISSQGGINFYMGNNPEADGRSAQPPGRITARGEFLDDAWLASVVLAEEAEGESLKPSKVSRFWYLEGVRFILEHPWQWSKLMSRKLAYFWTGVEVTNNEDAYYFTRFSNMLGLLMWQKVISFPFGLICPLALVGIIVSRKHWRKLLLLYGFIFFYMGSVVAFFVCARYRMPVVPVLLIFAGYTIYYCVERLKWRRYKSFLYCLAGTIFLGVLANIDIGGVTDRNRARAHLYGGRAYEARENYALAIEEYQSAIKLVPDHLQANHGLGILYMKMERYEMAEKIFKKVLGIDAYLAPAHFNLGSVYVAQNRYAEAIDEYEAALGIDPNYELAAAWAAVVYERLDQRDEALKKWERVLQINPYNQQAKRKIEEAKQGMQ